MLPKRFADLLVKGADAYAAGAFGFLNGTINSMAEAQILKETTDEERKFLDEVIKGITESAGYARMMRKDEAR
jgi:hypothetical protein